MKKLLAITLLVSAMLPMRSDAVDFDTAGCHNLPDIQCWCMVYLFEIPWAGLFERNFVVSISWGDAAGGSYAMAYARMQALYDGQVKKRPSSGMYATAMNPGPSTGGEIFIPFVVPCVQGQTNASYFAAAGDFRLDDYLSNASFYNCEAVDFFQLPPGWQ